jgi:diaminopimelate decarboxylase
MNVFSDTVKNIKEKLANNVNLCFSLKANPWLVNQAFEVADKIETCSPGEIEVCRHNLGDNLKNVIYGGVAKEESDILYALESGIVKFSIESIQQLQVLSDCAEKQKIRPQVLLRITSGNQFGLDVNEVLSLFDNNAFPSILEFVGIHYFSGTQRLDVKSVERDFADLLSILDKLDEIGIKEVEYGAGVGFDYYTHKSNTEVWTKVIDSINRLSEKYNVTYESGRALSAECGTYITRIVEVRKRGNKFYYITDGGKHQIEYYSGLFAKMKTPDFSVVTPDPDNDIANVIVVGSLCTIGDVLANESSQPKAKVGDYIVFHKCGGYSVTENIALFLTRDLPTVYSLNNGELNVLRAGKSVVEFNIKKHNDML